MLAHFQQVCSLNWPLGDGDGDDNGDGKINILFYYLKKKIKKNVIVRFVGSY